MSVEESRSSKPGWTEEEGWARGADAEKEVKKGGPFEIFKIRFLKKVESFEGRTRGMTDDYTQNVNIAQAQFCRELLKSPVMERYESFPRMQRGFLDFKNWSSDPISLRELVPFDENRGPYFLPNDFRRAAQALVERFPEISFEFEETPENFSYIARLNPPKESE